MTTIYVGNLPYTSTEEDIRAMFAQHGSVNSVKLITDRDTGRSRGFAFVDMDSADARKAIPKLNGAELGGRTLKVTEAARDNKKSRRW